LKQVQFLANSIEIYLSIYWGHHWGFCYSGQY